MDISNGMFQYEPWRFCLRVLGVRFGWRATKTSLALALENQKIAAPINYMNMAYRQSYFIDIP